MQAMRMFYLFGFSEPTPCRGRKSMQIVFIQYAQAH